MAKEVSDKVVILLVIVALLISLASTYVITVYVGNINPITVKTIEKIYSPPTQSSGNVNIVVVPKEEG